jgi:hypothetical protein
MSKHESWRTKRYWEAVGGLLIEEFRAIKGSSKDDVAKRHIDGVIVLGEAVGLQIGGAFDLTGRDIIVVQTKANRLGMYLMGQALFSREIMKRYNPKSIKTVAICGKTDTEMEVLCKQFGIDVIVIAESEKD